MLHATSYFCCIIVYVQNYLIDINRLHYAPVLQTTGIVTYVVCGAYNLVSKMWWVCCLFCFFVFF